METVHKLDVVPFAETSYRNHNRRFGIKIADRRQHVYIVGKTGMGKSVVLENMIISDIRNGHGLAVVDPHGDLVQKIVDIIPAHRINDVIYFNPADIDYPIAFNVLESVDPRYRHLVSSGLVGVFKKIWADSWGPRLEYILRNAILSLLEYPGSTLLGITRILVDKKYRRKVLEKVTDPVVRSFWLDEYDNYNEKFRVEAVSPIQNKIGQFLSSSVIRNIVGQPKSSIDVRDIMDNEKILLLDLAKGKMGEDNSALLGAMMITKLQLAAMSRIDIPESHRRDFFLYVDEFQNFITESFANILSEARKYRLNLILAHQYIEQLGDVVKAAVFGNVGTIICFRVGAEDAEFLEKEFEPIFVQNDLVNLPRFNIYLKLMIDGVTSDPFSARTLPPIAQLTHNRDKIINVSRERYASKREVVEKKILRWTGVEDMFKETAKAESKSLAAEDKMYKDNSRRIIKSDEPLFEDQCWVCGKKVQLTFKPDGIRPVYCKEDIKKMRQGLIPKPKPRLVVQESQKPRVPPVKLEEKASMSNHNKNNEAVTSQPVAVIPHDVIVKDTGPAISLNDLLNRKETRQVVEPLYHNRLPEVNHQSNNDHNLNRLKPGEVAHF
ncbi:MAG: type IV secretion system DNA-binding domain-containing protein [Patescibacteria group bacterium]